MRAVIQRVSESKVETNNKFISSIKKGLTVLLGIEQLDEHEDADYLIKKISQLRIFSDADQNMNLSINQVDGEVLVVSQFTLHASIKKGNRPSFIRSAKPEKAKILYQYFIDGLSKCVENKIQTGEFGAMMNVHLINDGPVTILIDSKTKE